VNDAARIRELIAMGADAIGSDWPDTVLRVKSEA
jgi:glycerophosphoryl diester phosphodiesterase